MRGVCGGTQRFAVCVEVGEYQASLETWKIYRVLPDPDAERHQQIRVVDESGEDYIYPRAYFRPLNLPAPARRAVRVVPPLPKGEGDRG